MFLDGRNDDLADFAKKMIAYKEKRVVFSTFALNNNVGNTNNDNNNENQEL